MTKSKQTTSAVPTWLSVAFSCLCLSVSARDQLVGIGHREQLTFEGVSKLSLMGGARLLVKAESGLNDQAGANFLKYHNWQTQQSLTLYGDGLSRDDEFFSNPQEGKLGFTTPSVMELFNADFDDFNGAGVLPSGGWVEVWTSVTNADKPNKDIWCQNEMYCRLSYSRGYTPVLVDVVPNQIYKDQHIDWWTKVQAVHSQGTPSGRMPFEELSIDGSLNNWSGYVDSSTRLNGYYPEKMSAKAGDQKPNAYSVPRARFYTGDSLFENTAKHCNFAGDDCWNVRTHARIDSVSANTGATVGGQKLTVSGWGFASGVEISVAGVPCEVTASSDEEVTCVTGASIASVDGVPQPGQHGMARKIYDLASTPNLSGLQARSYTQTGEDLQLTFETPDEGVEKIGYVWDGYFKAPATGEYRFYISCDDSCRLLLDSANPLSSGLPADPMTIAERWWYGNWRDYLDPPSVDDDNQYISEWITLTEGEFYKMDAAHAQGGGGAHFTTSVEFKTVAGGSASHPKSRKAVQQFVIDQSNVAETWKVIITDPSSGLYSLIFTDPVTGAFIKPEKYLTAQDSADTFRDKIYKPYYKNHVKSQVSVERLTFDAAGIPDPVDPADIKTLEYIVSVDKRLTGGSFQAINVVKDPANPSQIQLVKPTDIGGSLSSAPLSGKFILNCVDPATNLVSSTDEISPFTWGPGIEQQINDHIPFLSSKVRVKDLSVKDQKYWDNARRFAIEFHSVEQEVSQCYLSNGIIEPLTGATPVLSQSMISVHGTNLMFEPIPMEMLYTAATKPQIIVTVDGIPAACANNNCDYLYVDSAAEVTSQSLAGNTLTIGGINLPTNLVDVRLGDVGCGSTTGSATQIVCTLQAGPAAGTYDKVEVIAADGRVPVNAGVTPITVNLSIVQVSPSTNINTAGGDILVIDGSGLPQDPSNIQIMFSDNTSCMVMETSDTQVKCQVEGFDPATVDVLSPYQVNVQVNPISATSLAADSSLSVELALGSQADRVTPSTASPVLKQDLVVQLQSNFENIIDINDWSAFITSRTDPTYQRDLYIKDFDNVAKTMTLKFNGAPSDTYRITIAGPNGFVGGAPLNLETVIAVDSITPSSGSVLGGTLLTITGGHFGNVPTDNPVKIGNNYCIIEETSDALIKCRILIDTPTVASTAQVIVFAKVSEEMVCNIRPGCDYDYVDSTTTVSGISESFDAATNTIQLTVTGTGFPVADVANTELWLDGAKQETVSVDATTAVFNVNDVADANVLDVKFYTAEGLPTGSLNALSLTPALISVSPSVGSSGGTLITVSGVGFGVESTGVNLFHSQSAQNLCEEVEVYAYGTFTCQTIAQTVASTDDLMLVVAGSNYACANTATPAECKLTQELASSPSISSVSITGDILSFTGVNFPAGLAVSCEFQGVNALAVYTSGSTVDCTFDSGVPAADTPVAPKLRFTNFGTGVQLIADANGQTLSNPLSIGSGSTGLECSFAGGCLYSVAGNGVAGSLLSSADNKIELCGNECVFDQSNSDSSQATCILPPLATTYSANTFDLVSSAPLEVTWMGTGSDLTALNDGLNTVDSMDATASNCYAEVTARSGYVYALDEVKIFLNNLLDKNPFTGGNLILQGSNDGTNFVEIYSYDEMIHEGWNSVDWRDSSPQVYSTFRLQGAVQGSCRIGEVKLTGVEVLDDAMTSTTCTASITIDGASTDLTDVVYNGAITPVLTAVTGVSPRYGSVLGGEQVTFSGSGFTGTAFVTIDSRPCAVDSQTATQIVCTTADKPFVPDEPTLEISIDGVGFVSTRGLVYRYVSRWSDVETWGYDIPPLEGEAVEIPKGQHLLVDVPNPPKLEFVIVYGSLIFPSNDADPMAEATFDAGYIFVNGGYVEIGTEDFPYMSKLTITMHGDVSDPYLPVYGNKVLGVRFGTLEMHGKPRSLVWTDLGQTAAAGATTITLSDVGGVPLDWAVGDKIVIASTDYDGKHAEERTITAVTSASTMPVLTLDEALEYEHLGVTETFGGEAIEMRAEVGLLSRNVVYRGDPETSQTNQYGAHIMLHSPGDESVIGRIENCEFTDVGQAFKLGRYPIHFHMIGTVQKSYIKNNSIHQTYNRATTLHGVHYLEISGNVAYKAMGHTIFIEDAIETKNLIENNLVIDTRASNSLLNTDQTPACFWITNPDNIFRGNHAAGSDRYGYWFDLQKTSIGPSFDPNVCPENTKLGEFSDNVAHSVGRYGLRIFHNLIPRTNPCQPLEADPLMPNDPYHANPVIPAQFHRLTSYKNGRNGAIAERVGAVEFIDFKVADNILAGMEMSLTENMLDGYANVIRGTVVGKTAANSEAEISGASPHGIIGPRSEGFTISGTSFFNFNFNNAAALGDCSHCFHPASTDSGARTVTTEALTFDASVNRKILYQYPFRGIFRDLDGSLTGLAMGAGSYATKGYTHVEQPECTRDDAVFDGVVCDNTVEIRRIAFYGYQPSHFRGQNMNIAKYDASDINPLSTVEKDAFLADSNNFSSIFWKEKLKPNNGWAVPFVTNHRYRVSWANDLDYTKMFVELSDRWESTDSNVQFVVPFVDAREAINVTDTSSGNQIMDETLLQPNGDWEMGFNYLQNATDIREFQFVANAKNPDVTKIKLEGLQCISGTCPQAAVVIVPISADAKFWSQDASWPSGKKPQAGEDVHIEPGMNMVLDEETPLLGLVTINGRLSFYDAGRPIHLQAKHVYVRAGELLIGSESAPFQADAKITLFGERREATTIMSGAVETGNKVIVNTALMSMHGMQRDRDSRLRRNVFKDDTMVVVGTDLDWTVGDELYFAPTNHQWMHSEYKTVAAYNSVTGELTVDSPFSFYHFGQETSTAADYNGIDMRGEVRLLTRNVKIIGAPNNDNWGGNILTMDRMEFDGTFRYATTQLDNVEVEGCSQENTYHAAIRFESTGETAESYVRNSVVHNSQAWSLFISASKNIVIENSDFIGAKAIGINLNSVNNVELDNLFIGDVSKRVWAGGDQTLDIEACVAFCSYWEPNMCFNSQVTNSIAAGCAFAGFVAPGHDCDDSSSLKFNNNVAHSGERVGAHIYPDPASSKSSSCYEGSNFAAYKNRDGGLTTMYNTRDLRMRDMTFIDNEKGVCLQTAGEGEDIKISMTDVEIYGETANLDAPAGQSGYCKDKYGLMLFGSNRGGKPLHPTMASQLPVHKIKSYGSWGGQVNLENVNFHDFSSPTTQTCGKRQSAIQRNPYSADYIPIHKFSSTTFDNVAEQAVIWLQDPNPAWANPTDCIEWPCTAPENVVLQFEGATYRGVNTPVNTQLEFQIVSDVTAAVEAYDNCQMKSYWSAGYCRNRNLGVLLFESLDADNEDRSIQPVRITREDNGYENVLNAFMDHMWDGFYTGQKRLSRFPAQIQTDGGDYLMEFTGTPASTMRFTLHADQGALLVRVPYPNAGSYTIYANGVAKPYTDWDSDLGRASPLSKNEGCGENRYVGVENFLEFYLTTDCEIRVEPRDSIMVSVRLDWTLEGFYADGGVDTFTDRMAGVLGVHASQIKTVAVYQGSVIVEFFVDTEVDDEEPRETLRAVENAFVDAIMNDSLNLGAPIIDAMSDNRIVKTGFEGTHGQDHTGNLWDHLVRDNTDEQAAGGDQTNQSGSTNGNFDASTSSQDQNGQYQNGQITIDPTQSNTIITQVVSQEVEAPAMTETVKYLIVFLAVLSMALLIVIGYVAMKMCSRREVKPPRRSLKDMDPQFVVAADEAKDIFSGRRRQKNNHADTLGEVTSAGGSRGTSSQMKLRTPDLRFTDDDHQYTQAAPDSARPTHSARDE